MHSPRSQPKCRCLLAVQAFKNKCTLSGGEGRYFVNFAVSLLRLHLSQLLLQALLRFVQVWLIAFVSRKKQISQTRKVVLRAFKALGCSLQVR